METNTKLELRFGTENGKSRTLNINQPAQELDPVSVQAAMETIAAQGLFEADGVRLYEEIKGARYVTRAVEEIFETQEA